MRERKSLSTIVVALPPSLSRVATPLAIASAHFQPPPSSFSLRCESSTLSTPANYLGLSVMALQGADQRVIAGITSADMESDPEVVHQGDHVVAASVAPGEPTAGITLAPSPSLE